MLYELILKPVKIPHIFKIWNPAFQNSRRAPTFHLSLSTYQLLYQKLFRPSLRALRVKD